MKKRIVVLALLLAGCGHPFLPGEATIRSAVETATAGAPTQTPYVVVCPYGVVYTDTGIPHCIATPKVQITNTAIFTLEPTANSEVCPPRTFARMTVGYIPGMDIGVKKSPVSVNLGCAAISIMFDGGARVSGALSEDGLTILNCVFEGQGKVYPCELSIPQQSADNPYVQAWGYVFKKSAKELMCVAETNQSYAGVCE